MSLSGKRGSNSRPSAWKADALPTELLPLFAAQKAGFPAAPRKRKRVFFSPGLHGNSAKISRSHPLQQNKWEVVDSNHRTLRERIYSPPQLPLCEPPKVLFFRADRGIRTHDPEITNHVLWPTELYRRSNESFLAERTAKVDTFFEFTKFFRDFSSSPAEVHRGTLRPVRNRPAGSFGCPGGCSGPGCPHL